MNPNRKAWNAEQQDLLNALTRADYPRARTIFLRHHAQVHSAKMSGMDLWSFEDEVLDGLDETGWRKIPSAGEHSIAWNIWHIARIEDVTMNLLVAGADQLYFAEGWFARLKVPFRHAGNAMSREDVQRLSLEMDLAVLRSYRVAVGRRTQQLVETLPEPEFKRRVECSHLERVAAEGAVLPSASEIVDYWAKKDVAGLLLMPPTRHNFLHLNECLRCL